MLVSSSQSAGSLRCEEFIDKAAELARSVLPEAEESAKSAPTLARACLVFGHFRDRIELCRDGSQLFGQHVIHRFFSMGADMLL